MFYLLILICLFRINIMWNTKATTTTRQKLREDHHHHHQLLTKMEPRYLPSPNHRIKRSTKTTTTTTIKTQIATRQFTSQHNSSGWRRRRRSRDWLLVAFVTTFMVPLYLNAVVVAQGESIYAKRSKILYLDKIKHKQIYINRA